MNAVVKPNYLVFDKVTNDNSPAHRRWWNGDVRAQRGWADAQERTMLPYVNAMRVANGLPVLKANAAGILPRDAWLALDDVTRTVLRSDEGMTFMSDLMPLAKTVNIGKIVQLNRVSGDAGTVVRSLSGQVPVGMDKVAYDYRGTPVPIFSTAYGREWREWQSLQSENFDALSDDQEAHTAKIKRDMALYALDGDTNITFQGYSAYGIRTSPYSKAINVGASGYNIDLTAGATTAKQIADFFSQSMGTAFLDANFLAGGYNLYVSPQIWRNFQRPISDGAGLVLGTIYDQLLKAGEIRSIKRTFELTGNTFFGFVPDAQYIRPLIGMAVNTTPTVRLNPTDNYNFLIMAAMGLEIRADVNGRGGVFYSTSS